MNRYFPILFLPLFFLNSCTPGVIIGGTFGLTVFNIAQDVPDKKIYKAQNISDQKIFEDIKSILILNNKKDIEFYVIDNTVILFGTVKNVRERIYISSLMWKIKGIINVINNINVIKKGENYKNDELINMKIKATLDVSTSSYSVYDTETLNGDVYLMGISKSKDDLKKTISLLNDIDEVNSVISMVILDINDYD